jgi:hypothetical protein
LRFGANRYIEIIQTKRLSKPNARGRIGVPAEVVMRYELTDLEVFLAVAEEAASRAARTAATLRLRR